jgi:alpha-1,2-mannosyltransferase
MRIAVAHHSLNIPGGAERLCLSLIEALRNEDHHVSLVTVEKTDWKLVQKNFGTVTLPNREEYLTRNRVSSRLASLPVSCVYFSTFMLQLLSNKSRRGYDLVINTFGDAINSLADITYIHFPLRAASALSQVPAFTKKSIWKTVSPLYGSAMSLLDKIAPGDLLTNSRFIQGIIRDILHRNSIVVYPPVNVEAFSSKCFKTRKGGCTVAIVASYTPKRHLERVPLIAKHSKHAKFTVVGKADEYSLPTLKRLEEQISRLRVQDRIALMKNVSFGQFREILSDAKIYLHVMPNDHFGISVVEAMASGCVPVVHKSGGPWIDILNEEQGVCGFSYSAPDEAANYIDTLITDESLRSTMASKALNRAKAFDKAVFMKRMVQVVEKVAG